MAWPSICFDAMLVSWQRVVMAADTELDIGAGAATAVSYRGHNLIHLPIREIFIIEVPTKVKSPITNL